MSPREDQPNRPAPSVGMPRSRRVGSLDMVTPRSFQRPGAMRPMASPSVQAQTLPPRQPMPATPAPLPAAPQPQPHPSPVPRVQPAVADNEDVQLTLAGPTPTAQATPIAPQAPVFIPSPKPAPVPPPETIKKKRRLPKIAWRKLLRRRVLIPLAALATVGLIVWGALLLVQYIQLQASPVTVYKQALEHALQTQKIAINTQKNSSTSSVLLNLSKLKNPVSSTTTQATIGGTTVGLAGYGTADATYVSYTALPSGIPTSTASAVTGQWVQLRQNAKLPAAITTQLTDAADPRYQAFGPFLFANLPKADAEKLAAFLITNKVYGYSLEKVTHEDVDGKKAFVFAGKFDAGYAKVAIRSLASSEGFGFNDVQSAADNLTQFEGATSTLYVDAASRLPIRLVLQPKTGDSTVYDFSKYNSAQLPAAPASSSDWPHFATTQLQLEAQASATLSKEHQDALRKASLTTMQLAIASYYGKTGLYPTLANMNDQSWIASNLLSFDPDVTRDPLGSSLSLLAAAPKPKVASKSAPAATPIFGYVYKPTTSSGQACINDRTVDISQQCAVYTLSATLSSGELLTVQSPAP